MLSGNARVGERRQPKHGRGVVAPSRTADEPPAKAEFADQFGSPWDERNYALGHACECQEITYETTQRTVYPARFGTVLATPQENGGALVQVGPKQRVPVAHASGGDEGGRQREIARDAE